jgi:uncharacterized peroxidase-related enzyme
MSSESETVEDVPAMTRYPVPDLDELPEDVRERIEEETERAGFTPNVFLAYAYLPSHFRAFFGYYDAITENSTLTRAEIEMIIVATSSANDCYYCIVAHGALLRIYSEQPLLADQIAANYRTADVSEAHRTMLDFAVELTESPGRVDETDMERMREAGFSVRQIWDVASVCAFFNLSNRMASVADMRPNAEFHTLGRSETGD